MGPASHLTCEEARDKHGRMRPDLEAAEAGQIRANLDKNLGQPEGQNSNRARPLVLKDVSQNGDASSAPECMPRIVSQQVVVGKRTVPLSDCEDVQSEPAPQGNHELVHVAEAGQQHMRDEGVGARELCLSSSDEVLPQQAHMAERPRA